MIIVRKENKGMVGKEKSAGKCDNCFQESEVFSCRTQDCDDGVVPEDRTRNNEFK